MRQFLRHFTHLSGSYERARLAVLFGLGFGAFCMCFVPILLLVSAPASAAWTGLCASGMIASAFVLRRRGSVALAGRLLVTAIAALFTGTSALLGGLQSPTTPLLAIAPIVAIFLLGRRAGYGWSAYVLVVAATLYVLEELRGPLPRYLDERYLLFLDMAGFGTLVGVGLVFLLQYDAGKSRSLRAMSQANERMVAMIRHLDATSAELRKSAAEFLGDGPRGGFRGDWREAGGQLGLTQQMMSATSSGRSMIAGVGDSIRGMIEQYKLISKRIYELHTQSGTISEMVRTIDSISDRLDMMALNTGIEAEHAGAAGLRFRLLADDMRRLAVRVVKETRRIKVTIRRVQEHTTAAIDASRAGQVLTDQGSTKLEVMSAAFDELYALVERTAAASKRITSDTVNQLATIHDLVDASLLDHEQPH